MSSSLTLYLRPDEKTLFQTLHGGSKQWKGGVEEETLQGYEPPEVIEQNLQNPPYASDPEYIRWVAKTERDAVMVKDPAHMMIMGFPEHLLADFFETCGATGISLLVEEILRNPQLSRQAVEGLCALTQLRHEILERNGVSS